MSKKIVSMTDSLVYSASAEVKTDLPKDRFVTGLLLDANVVYDTGTEVTEAEDALPKMVGGLKVDASRQTFVDITDVELLYWWAYFRSKGAIAQDAFVNTTSQSNLTKRLGIPIYFNPVAWTPFNRLAGIQASRGLTEFKLKINYPANTAGGTGVTTDATLSAKAAIFGLQPGPYAGFARPKYTQEDHSLAVKTGLGETINLPTGAFIRRTLLVQTTTATGARIDTDITELAVQIPKVQKLTPLQLDWYTAKAMSCVHLAQGGNVPAEGIPTGLVIIDWCDWLDDEDPGVSPLSRIYGLDMRDQDEGAIKLAFTVGTAHTLKVLHEQYEPVGG